MEFISGLVWWQLVIIIVVLTGCLLILLKSAGGSIELPWLKIKKKTHFDLKNCSHCGNASNLLKLFNVLSALSIKAHDIMGRGLLSAQMHHIEEYILNMKDRALTKTANYMETLLKDKKDVLAINHRDYLLFKLVIQELSFKIKDILRASCINNGFVEMPDIEFSKYVERQIERLSTTSISYIKQYYFGKVMNISEAFDSEFEKEIQSLIVSMFNRIRDIAKQKYEEVEEIENQKQEILQAELGDSVDLKQYKIKI